MYFQEQDRSSFGQSASKEDPIPLPVCPGQDLERTCVATLSTGGCNSTWAWGYVCTAKTILQQQVSEPKPTGLGSEGLWYGARSICRGMQAQTLEVGVGGKILFQILIASLSQDIYQKGPLDRLVWSASHRPSYALNPTIEMSRKKTRPIGDKTIMCHRQKIGKTEVHHLASFCVQLH